MRFAFLLAPLLWPLTLHAGGIPVLDRLAARAEVPAGADLLTQMRALRESALKEDVVSDPVSDRYLITELAGPIDIVHFLGLAIQVQLGKTPDEALWKEYVEEGGLDHEKGLTATYLTEAHPDDLPSNALGALFSSELASQPGARLLPALNAFLGPLRPLPDTQAKQFTHDENHPRLPPAGAEG